MSPACRVRPPVARPPPGSGSDGEPTCCPVHHCGSCSPPRVKGSPGRADQYARCLPSSAQMTSSSPSVYWKRAPPAVQVCGQAQLVFEQYPFGADHYGRVAVGEDQGGPGLGDHHPVVRVGPVGIEPPVGLLQGGPAQFVQNAGAQGGAEDRRQVVGGDPGDGLRVDLAGDHAERRQTPQRRSGTGQSRRPGEFRGAISQPVVEHGAEHRVGGDRGEDGVLRAMAVHAVQRVVQQSAQAGAAVEGRQVAAARGVVAYPALQREVDFGARRRFGDGDVPGDAGVQQVQVGARVPASLEEVGGAAVGAQPGGHALDEGEGARAALRTGRAVLAVQGPAAEPVRGVDALRALRVGEQFVRARLRQQRQPGLVSLPVVAEAGRHDLQEAGADLRSCGGERHQGRTVGVPERCGGPDDAR